MVVESPLPPTKLVNAWSTPPNVSPHWPKWMWTNSDCKSPAERDRTTCVLDPISVRVAVPVWPESFNSPKSMVTTRPGSTAMVRFNSVPSPCIHAGASIASIPSTVKWTIIPAKESSP